MQLNPYLNFNGRCGTAFRFHAHVRGGEFTILWTFAGSPMADEVPSD